MTQLTLSDLSQRMAQIDFAMLSTRAENGNIAARPMSNNGQVAYDGDSYFFALDTTHTVGEIERDPKVGLTFAGNKGASGQPPIFIAVEGTAELSRDKARFQDHWDADLDNWFEQGVDTPGLVMIKVHATRIHYWAGKDEGELTP
ncbi:pyridoxamine 5'-phosphate oxidase family protein [Roseomonas sp. BN140053]|uniref:pyridoxamine 5'-phosphate oxidase family protein n=1 Tax=Roseomonas sp. BN140053 TaxID=3391898 RepID=UPI0039EA7D74